MKSIENNISQEDFLASQQVCTLYLCIVCRYTANLAAYLVGKTQTSMCSSLAECISANDVFRIEKGTATHEWVLKTFPNIEVPILHLIYIAVPNDRKSSERLRFFGFIDNQNSVTLTVAKDEWDMHSQLYRQVGS